MPAIIIKRKNVVIGDTSYDTVSTVDTTTVVVVKEDQIEVYTDKEAEDLLSKG